MIKIKVINLKLLFIFLVLLCALLTNSCSKQTESGAMLASKTSDVFASEGNSLTTLKMRLKDSLSSEDFSSLDFNHVYKSKEFKSQNFYYRVKYLKESLSAKFLLVETDSVQKILRGSIVAVQKFNNNNGLYPAMKFLFTTSSLNRKTKRFITNVNLDSASKEEPAGQQTLDDVAVTCYVNGDNGGIDWYLFDDLIEWASSGGGGGTYGVAEPSGSSGDGGTQPDETGFITPENTSQPAISLESYLKCFSSISNANATYKITIYSDIPVNSNPYSLFDYHTGDCGHSFIQLVKTSGTTTIQQNIGFYPETGWKSLANSPTASKLVDNAGHAYNASLTITVDATHFQNALNEMQIESTAKYDIDDFNCTNYALSVFNVAAPQSLIIPQMHIPNGTFGTESDTPQGLYIELSTLQQSGGYPNGQISIPKIEPHAGSSHGACN